MKIEMMAVEKLKPYHKNPRKNNKAIEPVAASIEKHGFKQPILVDKKMVIISGHTRLKAAVALGLEEVPVIVASDLTPALAKSLRLADNKVAEVADWDFNLLDEELADLFKLDIDMTEFGFEIPDLGYTEDEPEEVEEKESHRNNTFKQYQLHNYDESRTVGAYDMPILEAVDHIPNDLMGFNYMLNTPDHEKTIHFFLDDYQFERIWQRPEFYIDKLAMFDATLTPDFSLYMDMPKAMQIWNTYRSRLIGQIMQDRGLTVIPTVSWSDPDSYEFCFDGLPSHGTLCTSTVGVRRYSEAMEVWKHGMDEMITRLEPTRLIIYGGPIEFDYGDIAVHFYENQVTERLEQYKGE